MSLKNWLIKFVLFISMLFYVICFNVKLLKLNITAVSLFQNANYRKCCEILQFAPHKQKKIIKCQRMSSTLSPLPQ